MRRRHRGIDAARRRLASTIAECPTERRLALADVLPALDALLLETLPAIDEHADFLRRYLNRVDPGALREEVRRWERSLFRADEPDARALRQRNLDLARAQAQRVDRLQAALRRYEDQLAGLVLAIDELASRIAAARVSAVVDPQPSVDRLRGDIDALSVELDELHGEI